MWPFPPKRFIFWPPKFAYLSTFPVLDSLFLSVLTILDSGSSPLSEAAYYTSGKLRDWLTWYP